MKRFLLRPQEMELLYVGSNGLQSPTEAAMRVYVCVCVCRNAAFYTAMCSL